MKKLVLAPGVAALGAALSGCVVAPAGHGYPVVVAPAPAPYYYVHGGEGGEGGEGGHGKKAKVIYPAPGWYYD